MYDLIQKHDWIISGIIVVLLTISCTLIYSTTYNTSDITEGAGSFPKQIAFITMGLIIYFSIIFFDIEWLKHKQVLGVIYIILIVALLYLKIFGTEVAGTQRWIQIGFINIQPSEYAKIMIVLLTSFILTSSESIFEITIEQNIFQKLTLRIKDKFNILKPIDEKVFTYFFSGLLISPIILLVFLQPALGNSMILSMIWLTIVFISLKNQSKIVMLLAVIILTTNSLYKLFSLSEFYSKFNINLIKNNFDVGFIIISTFLFILFLIKFKLDIRIFLIGVSLGLVIYPIITWSWNNVVADYQKKRVETFIQGAENDRYGAGYQVTQSKIAVGSGKLKGRGFLKGSQSSLKVLDLAYTDFIFAAYSEQFGFRGAVFLLIIYILLLLRIIYISLSIKNTFYSLVCIGVATMLLLNIFINAGMNMGILPVTGVPLPLVSYGGNSIIVNLIGLGIVQSIYTRSHNIKKKGDSNSVENNNSSSIDWSALHIR